mgnify:CR=1 FL=1
MLRIAIFLILLIGTCLYALWRGGAPERIAAGAMLAACLGSALVRRDLENRFFEMETGLFLIDALLLVILIAVALKADRGWPMVLAGLHLATVGAHVVKLVEPEMIRVTYVVMITAWSWPMLLALALGTARHRMRLKAQGYDLDWSLPIPASERPRFLRVEGRPRKRS